MSEFQHDLSKASWVLLYLHDWDPKREDGSQPVYPEIHGIYETEQLALLNQREMTNPSKYWVHKAYAVRRRGPSVAPTVAQATAASEQDHLTC